MENLTGLELLYLLSSSQFTCKEDCLVAAFHCMMLNDGKTCVGVGDEWTAPYDGGSSETLPSGWNSGNGVYSLRYFSSSPPVRYLLKIVKAGQSLLVNVLDVNEEKAAGMSVNVSLHVSDDYKEFSKAFINLAELSRNFHKEVLSQLTKQESGSFSAQNPKSSCKTDNLQLKEKVKHPGPRPAAAERMRPEERVLPSIGRGDLDPFGGVGGGMLADPSSFRFPPRPGVPNFGSFDPHGVPRGSVPPGARFDPFGPPGTGRGFPGPDPDHLPPPGYDDMFM